MRKLASLVMGLVTAAGITVASVGTASADVVVRRYPDSPPPSVTVVEHPERRGYVWVDGGYRWEHGRYVERRGHYVVERRGYRWEPERWELRHGHYYRVTGRWVR